MLTLRSLLLALMIGISASALGQVAPPPPLINFSGRLMQPNGSPVLDGTYSVRFSLWTALTGGTEKWNQTITNVTVSNGVFSVLLGNGNPITDTVVSTNLWLEIKIGSDSPLVPRQQIVSVPYALKAGTVPDSSITGSKIAGGTITPDKFSSSALSSLMWLLNGNRSTNPAAHFLGTTDNQHLIFRTNNAERMRITADGSVGIGATALSPVSKFIVAADSNVSLDAKQLLIQGSTNPANQVTLGYQTDGNYGSLQAGTVNVTVRPLILNPAGGNVGIGTTSPPQQLSIIGGIGFANQNASDKKLWSPADGLLRWQTHQDAGSHAFEIGHQGNAAGVHLDIAGNSWMNGGNVGISTQTPNYRLEVNGEVAASGFVNFSDGRYKTHVAPLDDALNAVLSLRGVLYDWRKNAPVSHLSTQRQIGFIAQEVEGILPNLVYTDANGYKSVNYIGVVPVLVEAVKTLKKDNDGKQQQLDELKAKNEALEARMNALEVLLRQQK